jgi:hypothetical protein
MGIKDEYLSRYPLYEFKMCRCLVDYNCNYRFQKGKDYECIFQINTITLIKIDKVINKIVALKTFGLDEFFDYFRFVELDELRNEKIGMLI